jgi:PAS domain S-box-containing protein
MPKEPSTRELAKRVAEQQRRIEELTRTQQLLWEAVKRYRVIVEAGPDAIAIVRNGKIRFVNSAFTRLLGYTGDDVDDELNFFDLIQDFDREAVWRQFEMNRHRDKWSVQVRTDLTAADGDLLPCDISVSRIDEAGKPAELLIIRGPFDRGQTEDETIKSRADRRFPPGTAGGGVPTKPDRCAAPLTDPLSAEKPPVALPANHLSVLEAQPDPTAAYDLTGRILFVNSSFTRVFGWRAEELIGKRIDFVPDESWPQTADAIDRLLQGEKIESFDTRRRTKDGRLLDIELSASLFYGPDGRPGGSIVILRDVTGVKRSKSELQRSEKKFRRLVETMNAGFGILAEEGKILYANRKLQELTGYAKSELVGRRWEDFLDETGRGILEQAKAGFEQGVWQPFELDIRRKEGKLVSLLVAPSPLLDAGGAACGSVAVYTEISGRKQSRGAPAGSEEERPTENRRLKQTGTAGETGSRQSG